MINKDSIKEGIIFWYYPKIPGSQIHHPVKITQVCENLFEYQHLLDGKKSGKLNMDEENILKTLYPCSNNEANDYIQQKIKIFEEEIAAAEKALNSKRKKLHNFTANAFTFLAPQKD